MSVVARQARRRWALVAAGAAVLLALPAGGHAVRAAVAGAGPAATVRVSAQEVVRAALGSAAVPHSGTARTRGSLGLPDLPSLGGVAGLLGGTTRTRVWWSGPGAWRVDTTTTTGERGDYGVGADVVSWDYERRTLTRTGTGGGDGLRLPRADDLLPPQAARLLLASLGPRDRLEVLERRLVAGRPATGVRAVPGDGRSTIAQADVWVDDVSGLPLELRVTGTDGRDALVSVFLDVRLGAPAPDVIEPPAAPGARREQAAPDVVARADLESPWDLPDELAGLPASRRPLAGTAVYGDGLARVVVVPVPPRLAREVISAARRDNGSALDLVRGEAVLVGTPLITLVVARGDDDRHAYVVAGLVDPATVEAATAALLLDPPPLRADTGSP